MFKEISDDPVFYFDRPNLVLPKVVIPPHRQNWMARMEKTRRYVYQGIIPIIYEPIVRDNLLFHTKRVVIWALTSPYLEPADVEETADFAMIHDADEIDEKQDMTTPDKQTDPQTARRLQLKGVVIARRELTAEDFQRWLVYNTAKPLLEGKINIEDLEVEFNPNAIVAKILDVADNETYFHDWYRFLKQKYGPFAKGFFPPSAFNVTFPRLRLYRSNIPNLRLPPAHLTLIEELLAEVEADGRNADQIEN